MSDITAVIAAEWRSHLSDTEKGRHGGTNGAFAARRHQWVNSLYRKQMSIGEARDWRWEHHSLLSDLKLIAYRVIENDGREG